MFFILTENENYVIFYCFFFYIVYASYFVFDSVLNKYSNNYKLLTDDKKMYSVSNILKSVHLSIITLPAADILYQTMYLDVWNNNYIKNVGILYAIPDCVSLLMVNKMDRTTKIHHWIVCCFNVVSIYNDYEQENIVRCMIIYACFSCFAYIVNFLLGIRYINNNKTLIKNLSAVAFYVYSLCCFINWCWHIKYFNTLIYKCDNIVCRITIPTYYLMISALAFDDIKLNKWLYKNKNVKLIEE